MAKRIRVGDKFRVYIPMVMGMIEEGTVIAITKNPGKVVGVEFGKPLGGHSCDGRGKAGYCLWAHPENLMDEREYENYVATRGTPAPPRVEEEFEELVIGDDGKVVHNKVAATR